MKIPRPCVALSNSHGLLPSVRLTGLALGCFHATDDWIASDREQMASSKGFHVVHCPRKVSRRQNFFRLSSAVFRTEGDSRTTQLYVCCQRGHMKYRYTPQNDVSANNGPRIRRWSLKIMTLKYIIILLCYDCLQYNMLYRFVA